MIAIGLWVYFLKKNALHHRAEPQALAQTPGPDLARQDAVMQSEAFIVSENNCMPTSRRARAGWLARIEFHSFYSRSITEATECSIKSRLPIPSRSRDGEGGIHLSLEP